MDLNELRKLSNFGFSEGCLFYCLRHCFYSPFAPGNFICLFNIKSTDVGDLLWKGMYWVKWKMRRILSWNKITKSHRRNLDNREILVVPRNDSINPCLNFDRKEIECSFEANRNIRNAPLNPPTYIPSICWIKMIVNSLKFILTQKLKF